MKKSFFDFDFDFAFFFSIRNSVFDCWEYSREKGTNYQFLTFRFIFIKKRLLFDEIEASWHISIQRILFSWQPNSGLCFALSHGVCFVVAESRNSRFSSGDSEANKGSFSVWWWKIKFCDQWCGCGQCNIHLLLSISLYFQPKLLYCSVLFQETKKSDSGSLSVMGIFCKQIWF